MLLANPSHERFSPLHDLTHRVTFERGFVTRAELMLADFREPGAEARGKAITLGDLFERAPLLRHLDLRFHASLNPYGGVSVAEEWASIEARYAIVIGQLRSSHPLRALTSSPYVTVEPSDYTDMGSTHGFADELLALLARSPVCREQLEEAHLGDSKPSPTGLRTLEQLSALTSFSAWTELAGARAYVELVASMPRLRDVDPFGWQPRLTGAELATFLAAPEVASARLRTIHLQARESADLERIAAAPSLSSLEALTISTRSIPHDNLTRGFEAIAASPHLANLRELRVPFAGTNVVLKRLAESRFADRLERLDISYSPTTEVGVNVILHAFPMLEDLDIIQCGALQPSARQKLHAVIPNVRA